MLTLSVILQVILFALAAILPIIGLVRLLVGAQQSLRKAKATVLEPIPGLYEVDPFLALVDERAPRRETKQLIWDLALVGAGLLAGSVASIWSLLEAVLM
jgi:hypothetical protein